VADKAIQLEEKEVWGKDNTMVTVKLPHVLRDICIGCGICEYKCPVNGESAIRVFVPQSRTILKLQRNVIFLSFDMSF